MSLVALGAEARSYGNTLIDIAEMAFWRANPALRLVGVAESKKSLEGRIRHMITRPIPTNARVGAWGLLIVLGIAAVLLPMAQAQRQDAAAPAPQATPGQGAVAVVNGVTVELVGLCQNPAAKGQPWWRPDGTPMEEPEVRAWNDSKYPAVGFLLKFTPAEDVDYRSQTPLVRLPGSQVQITPDGQAAVLYGSNSPLTEPLPNQADIEVDVAADDWSTDKPITTMGRRAGTGPLYRRATSTPDGHDILLSGLRPDPRQDEMSKTLIEVTTAAADVDIRLECTTTDGRHLASRFREGPLFSDGHLLQRTLGFAASMEEMQTIAIKQRPFHHVVFRNVSLRLGQKTNVQVSTEGGALKGSVRTYYVNRSVADFPSAEDLSTPEAAYATINRIARDDPSAWQKVSIASLAERLAQESRQRKATADPEWAKVLLQARIRDVIVWKDEQAAVIAELPQGLSGKQIVASIDVRHFQRERGRWLNAGNNRFVTVEEAEVDFMARFEGAGPKAVERPKADPVTVMGHLRQVALAAIMYAEEHKGSFASDLVELKPYLGDDTRFAQIMQNVVYLGKGVKRDGVSSPAAQPLAYWKTATATDGIAVAFFDGHAEVVKGDRLTKLGIVISVPAAAPRSGPPGAVRTYEVNRRVADFPPTEDLSTPEAAYATINRIDRNDPSVWQKVSVAAPAERFAREGSTRRTAVDPEWAKILLNARIRAVVIWNMTRAAVIAELPQEPSGKKIVDPIDVRHLQLENGRWLNLGNSRFRSIEEAKTQFLGRIERETTVPEALRDPLRHAGEIKEAAAHLFERLRTADYADILSHYRDGKWDPEGWKKFPTQGLYMVHTDYPSFALWCCTHFKDNPIIDVQLGDVFIGDALVIGKTGWPTVPYKLTLKDGSILAGNLPFNYDLNQGSGHWHGMEGIDWHLWSRR